MYNFFYRLRNKIAYFMQGRYGVDELFKPMVIACVVLWVAARIFWFVWLGLLGDFIFLLAILRCCSKNFDARKRERAMYFRFKSNMTEFWKRTKKRREEGKTHKFFKCKVCRTTMRVPKGKGKIQITCPRCGTKTIKKT